MHWKFPKFDIKKIENISQKYNIPSLHAKIMISRGLEDEHVIDSYFNKKLSDLYDPFLMKDMNKAVERIIHNIQNKVPIFIAGDYDVDGMTSASILYLGIEALGGNAITYIPHRKKDGRGLSTNAIDLAEQSGSNLIITCDCGINQISQINYANLKNIDVVISDHHIAQSLLPNAYAIINPKQSECKYPFKDLSSAGVVWKILLGIVQKINFPPKIMFNLLDLVALGTAADLVPLKNENRILVHYGLKSMNEKMRLGIRELFKVANFTIKENISVTDLLFILAPRINAVGRLGDANEAVKLLTTNDRSIAASLAMSLNNSNKKRQNIQKLVYEDACSMIYNTIDLEKERIIVLDSKDWHQGVIGIIASKLKEKFCRPVIIIAYDSNGCGKASGRSIHGLDLYATLFKTKDLLFEYGGHPMAAGFSIDEKNVKKFKRSISSIVNQTISKESLNPVLNLDVDVQIIDINQRLVSFLKKMSPFGQGNKYPKFGVMDVNVIGDPKINRNGNHIRFQIKQNKKIIDVVGFGLADYYKILIMGKKIDIACSIENTIWRGKEFIQLNAKDIRLSDLN